MQKELQKIFIENTEKKYDICVEKISPFRGSIIVETKDVKFIAKKVFITPEKW